MKSKFSKQQRKEIVKDAKSILHTFRAYEHQYLNSFMFRALRYVIRNAGYSV